MDAAGATSSVIPLRPPQGEPVLAPGEANVRVPLVTDGALLSGDGGEWEASNEARRVLALTTEGLFIVENQRTNMHVLDYAARVERKMPHVKRYYVSFNDIVSAYDQHRRNVAAVVSIDSTAAEEQRRVVQLMVEGLRDDASDIHFIVGRDSCDVRFRTLGELETRHSYSRDDGLRLVASLYGSMCDVASQNFNPGVSQDARLKASYTESMGLYGARVATRPTHDGLLMVLRLLKSDDRILTHAELGFLPQQIELFEHMASRSFGVSIISGPTGSGKSRTLQATMSMILQRERFTCNLITIEDPPEYPIPGAIVTPLKVSDRSDPEKVNQEWRGAISNAMRLDPDYIMVGEIRDLGSANTAFAAAMTGHGVWGTLHANDATSIAERLIDIHVDREKVTDPTLLTGITAQRLLPVLCKNCKIPLREGAKRLPGPTYQRLLEVSPPGALERVCVRGNGCQVCKGRGITSRTPVIEAIVPTLKFMRTFRDEGKLAARRLWVNDMSGITMNRHALHLVWSGKVDPLSAEEVVPLDNDLHLLGVNYASGDKLGVGDAVQG